MCGSVYWLPESPAKSGLFSNRPKSLSPLRTGDYEEQCAGASSGFHRSLRVAGYGERQIDMHAGQGMGTEGAIRVEDVNPDPDSAADAAAKLSHHC